MSVVDRVLNGSPIGSPPLTVAEAIAAVLVAAVAVDGVVNPEEAVRINGVLTTSHVLRQAGNGSMQGLAERAIALLTEYGLAAILTGCAKVIPSDLRPTTFALATDLALADGRIGDREKTFIDELQTVLQIDDATALKIIEVLLIKNRG
jgi:tellurite resistance protein